MIKDESSLELRGTAKDSCQSSEEFNDDDAVTKGSGTNFAVNVKSCLEI